MEPPPTRFLMRALFHDPTPSGLINQRIVQHFFGLSGPCTLSADEGRDFQRTLTMVANKLAAVWYHRDRYAAAEDRRVAQERERPISHDAQGATIGYSNELFFEFDAFLVQVKSCLDHLAKFPRPFVGRGWTLATFGDKGKDVIKAARNNVPDRLRGFAEGYVHLVEEHESWLVDTIRARDRLNHMQEGGIDPAEQFVVCALRDAAGSVKVRVPMWSPEQTLHDFMDVAWRNLCALCEDFIGVSLAMRVPEEWRLMRGESTPSDSPESPWFPIPKTEAEKLVSQGGWSARKPPAREQRPRK